MKSLLVFLSLAAVASAAGVPFVTPYSAGFPAFYNGYNSLPYGYSYGYNTATPYSYGYQTATPYGFSYSTVGATPYAAVAPAVVPAAVPAAVAAPYAPAFYSYEGGQSQYRTQDGFGNSAFGYAGGPSSRNEVRRADGVVQGSFSYVDGNNVVQSRSYVADALGFRVAGTDIPAAPAPAVAAVAAVPAYAPAAPAVVVKAANPAVIIEGPGYVPVEGIDVPHKTPEVKAAEAEHFAAHAEARSRVKREADPEPNWNKPVKAWPSAKKSAVKGRNQYPIASVRVPAKGGNGKRWRREADPEPKGKKGYGYGRPRAYYAPKKVILLKKW